MFTRRAGRRYYAAQAVAGLAWWIAVFTLPVVWTDTLGGLDPVPVACLDVPLFVLASVLAAAGVRRAAWVASGWTLLVAVGMAVYATVTGLAGTGALVMIAAAGCSAVALVLVHFGRLPTERLLVGPFAFREAAEARLGRHARRTAGQLVFFWGLFLGVIPFGIALVEARWGLRIAPARAAIVVLGTFLFLAASALGIWSAATMSLRGEGTPLPSAMARRLVVGGPYRWVRNPMAIAGITQGVAVGMIAGSWLVVLYALAGSLVWNWGIRPHEEADLERRFGAEFTEYRDRVACWIPARRSAVGLRANWRSDRIQNIE